MTTRVTPVKERNHTFYGYAANSMLVGSAAGLAAKHILPLSKAEMNTDEYVAVTRAIEQHSRAYSSETADFVRTISSKENKAVFEDEFVKMFAGAKEGKNIEIAKIRTAITNLREKDPEQYRAFRRLCKVLTDKAKVSATHYIEAYNGHVKASRPGTLYLAVGMLTGVGIALANEVLSSFKKS